MGQAVLVGALPELGAYGPHIYVSTVNRCAKTGTTVLSRRACFAKLCVGA